MSKKVQISKVLKKIRNLDGLMPLHWGVLPLTKSFITISPWEDVAGEKRLQEHSQKWKMESGKECLYGY